MLRTIFLSTLMLLTCLTAGAQKNKVKKDVIYLDKAPVATIMGEAGVDHTLFTVMAKGQEIIKVTDGHFNIDNPFFKNFSWYTVEFSDTGKN